MSPNQLYRWLGNRGVILRCFALRRLALRHLTLRPLFRAVICVTVRCAMHGAILLCQHGERQIV